MIKRLQTPEEVSILFPKLPSSWVQWVTENCTNPKVYIIAEIENEIVGYVIGVESLCPPVGDYFAILFDGLNSLLAIEKLKEYAKQRNAASIIITVKEEIEKLKRIGFKQSSINMRLSV